MNTVSGFTCDCDDTGFQGLTCDVDIDDCENAPCRNNGTCLDKVLGYQCTCSVGYKGLQCTEDIEECVEGAHKCEHSSTCSNTMGSYTCLCPDTYTGNI